MNNLFEQKKQDEALVYALENSCFPIFHEGFEEFENEFAIKKSEEEIFYKYIDEMITNQKYETYYEIERKFGDKENRNNIITMLKYAVLTGRFSEEDFKKKLLEKPNCPIEAKRIFK